jgi:integrase
MKFTQASIARLTLPGGKNEAIIFDDDVPGFGLRLRASGSRTFIVQYSLGGRQRRMSLGTTKILDAATARQTARNLLAKVRLGHDPAVERTAARARASDAPLGAIIGRFLERQHRRVRPRSYDESKRYLERYLKPLHALHLASIDRATVAARLGKIASEHGAVTADRARAALSSFFAWAIGEGLCETNPVVGTNKHFDGETSRDRVLTDPELAVIWKALPDSDYGAIVRLLILTGQRREEIGALRWSEVDLVKREIALPSARTKNHRAHDIPLSDQALAVLKSRPARAGRDLMFGVGPAKGFQGWAKAKRVLDQQASSVGPWRLHDVRRTVATRMAELGVLPHVVEAVLNHVSGHKAGVAGVYNRSSYAHEKREALYFWGKHIAALTGDDNRSDGERIVRFPARAGK